MNFGEVLCKEAAKDELERKVWALMKQPLLEIAGDRHAAGCHIKFTGMFASNTFINCIKNIIEADGVMANISNYKEKFGDNGALIWCKIPIEYGYENISDRLLTVYDLDNQIKVEIGEKESVVKRSYNTYIN